MSARGLLHSDNDSNASRVHPDLDERERQLRVSHLAILLDGCKGNNEANITLSAKSGLASNHTLSDCGCCVLLLLTCRELREVISAELHLLPLCILESEVRHDGDENWSAKRREREERGKREKRKRS